MGLQRKGRTVVHPKIILQNNLTEQRSIKARRWERRTERGPFGQGNRRKYLTRPGKEQIVLLSGSMIVGLEQV